MDGVVEKFDRISRLVFSLQIYLSYSYPPLCLLIILPLISSCCSIHISHTLKLVTERSRRHGRCATPFSTSYYLSISTSNQKDESATCKDSDDHLFSFAKPSFKSFKPKSSEDEKIPHKQRTKKKVVVKLDWPFFSVVKCKEADVGSSSTCINDTDEDAKDSSLDEEEEEIVDDDCGKPKWDASESFHSCGVKIVKEGCEESDLNYATDESSCTDIIKAEAEEIARYGFGSFASRSGGSDITIEIAPSLRGTMTALSTRANPRSSLQLLERFWMPNLFCCFVGRMVRSIEYSHHLFSMMLRMDLKRRMMYKAEKMNVKMKAMKGKIGAWRSKEVQELWKKRILMGNRCQRVHFADSFYDTEGKQIAEYGNDHLELDMGGGGGGGGEEGMIVEARVIRNLEYYLSK